MNRKQQNRKEITSKRKPHLTTTCPNCKGTGRSVKTNIICAKCGGRGLVHMSEIAHTTIIE